MATKREGSAVAELGPGPKLIVAGGRGKGGKTTLMRWAIEQALARGGEPVIADADRTNSTLTAFFEAAQRPPSVGNEDVRLWLNALVDTQIEKRHTIYLDLGGGDQMLRQWSRELDLAQFLASYDITPVLLHMLGSDVDDVAYLRTLEEVFAPAHTAIVLNEGTVPSGRSPQSAFGPVVERPEFQAAVSRGAKVLGMPRLGCMPEVDRRRVSFAAATDRSAKALPPTMQQAVQLWLREMPVALAPILEWIM